MADQFLDDVKELAHSIVAGLSVEQQIAYADEERAEARAAERRRISREAAEQRLAKQKEARRAEAEFAFGQEIRNRFFAKNPHATEADFTRLWPKLRDLEQ